MFTLLLLTACTARVHVQTSVPDAEITLIRSNAQPSEATANVGHRGQGELRTRVHYSVLDQWWVQVTAPDHEDRIFPYPQEIAPGPAVSCAAGVVVWPMLAGCFFASKPKSSSVFVDLEPSDALRSSR